MKINTKTIIGFVQAINSLSKALIESANEMEKLISKMNDLKCSRAELEEYNKQLRQAMDKLQVQTTKTKAIASLNENEITSRCLFCDKITPVQGHKFCCRSHQMKYAHQQRGHNLKPLSARRKHPQPSEPKTTDQAPTGETEAQPEPVAQIPQIDRTAIIPPHPNDDLIKKLKNEAKAKNVERPTIYHD
jgi:Zn finger protein HypA/HybF involved in hydrogenase expression